jgi:hypothetical protein
VWIDRITRCQIEVSDLGLVHQKGMTHLRKLNLKGTIITEARARDLQRALPKLKITH